jgi:hypothetical protein
LPQIKDQNVEMPKLDFKADYVLCEKFQPQNSYPLVSFFLLPFPAGYICIWEEILS